MKYGLSEKQLNEIIAILSTFTEIEEAILFGSRAIDTYKEASDVDIALKGDKVTASLAAKLKYQLEEDTYLPFFFDFVAYTTITNEALKEHIDTKGVLIYRAGWRECKLGDSGKVITGKTPSKDNPEDWGDDIPFITPSDYKNYSNKAYSSIRKLSPIGIERQKSRILPPFSVLVTCIGSDMGKSVVNALSCVTNQQINAIIPNKSIVNSDYLYYVTVNLYETLRSVGGDGTAVPILNKTDFENLDILLPPLSEQRAIASVLSSLDDKIDLLHHQNKTLEAMAETLFRQWFVEEAEDDWKTVRIGDFVKTNISSINKDCNLKTVRYLDTGSLTEGKIEDYQTFDIADTPSRARRIVKHNDVLISTVRPNQKHYGILKHPAEDIIVSTGFCVITCDKINPHFVYILLTTEEMTEYLHSIAEGSTSTYPSLKPFDIENIEFQLPPAEKLNTFSAYADSVWGKIDYNHTQIRTLEKLRDTLLPRLMSGEVRIPETISLQGKS